MCGRYNVTPNADAFIELFGILDNLEALPGSPQYNIAPSGQSVPVIRRQETRREIAMLRWPLIPHWAKEKRVKFNTANAKGETVREKPSFRQAWNKGQRCLVPAHGYYEWQKLPDGKKQPFHIHMPHYALFAFGGLWDLCRTHDGEIIESFTIITTPATRNLLEVHPRMPLVLPENEYETWLNKGDPFGCVKTHEEGSLEFYPVSTHVNNPRHNDPACLEPISL